MNDEEEEDDNSGKAQLNSGDKKLKTVELEQEVEALLNFVVGFITPKTIKLRGRIRKQ